MALLTLALAHRRAGRLDRGCWRRANRSTPRGVEPLVATLLLVAIALVLAAVLYVLVVNLTHGPSTPPLGSALALGPASVITGSAGTSPYCGAGDGCYSIGVAYAESSLNVGNLQLILQNSTGTVFIVPSGTSQISIVNSTGAVVASSPTIDAGHPLEVTTWTYGTGFSSGTRVTSLLSVWVDFGTSVPNPSHHGFLLEVVGVGGFQGTVLFALP